MVALLLTKFEYVALTFIAKKATQIMLLLIEINAFDIKSQYSKIKIIQNTKKQNELKLILQDKKKKHLQKKVF